MSLARDQPRAALGGQQADILAVPLADHRPGVAAAGGGGSAQDGRACRGASSWPPARRPDCPGVTPGGAAVSRPAQPAAIAPASGRPYGRPGVYGSPRQDPATVDRTVPRNQSHWGSTGGRCAIRRGQSLLWNDVSPRGRSTPTTTTSTSGRVRARRRRSEVGRSRGGGRATGRRS
jgi:hypothetical protein